MPAPSVRAAPGARAIVGLHYPHEGTQRIARALRDAGFATELIVPHDATTLYERARRVLGERSRVTRELRRRAFEPRGTTACRSRALVWSGLVRWRGGWPPAPELSPAIDRAIATRLDAGGISIAVALNDSGLRTFSVCRGRGIPSVMNLVANVWDEADALRAEFDAAADHPARLQIADEMPSLRRTLRLEEEMRQVGLVLVQSEHIRGVIGRRGIDPSKVAVIHNGVDLGRFIARVHEESARPLRLLHVGSVGGMGYRKGIQYAARAAEIAGAAVSDFRVAGRVNANGRLLRSRFPSVRFVGEVLPTELPDLYASSDVFVLPTLAESMARVVLEAMASGLPVIITPQSGYEGVVRDGVEGFVVPSRDPDAIAVRLLLLSRDGGLRGRMGRAAQARAQEFGWRQFEDRVLHAIAGAYPGIFS